MKKTYTSIIILLLALGSLSATKYAGEIFQIAPGVRNMAMGGTGLTSRQSLAAGWWNPALMSEDGDRGAELMYAEHFEGLLRQNQASIILGQQGNRLGFRTHIPFEYSEDGTASQIIKPGDDGMAYVGNSGNYFSIIINHLSINDIKLTHLEDPSDSLSNENRPEIWKTIGNNDLIVYGAIGRRINHKLSLGLAPKLAYRSLAENSGYAFGADLGLLYVHNMLGLGANLRDFFSSHVLWENGTYENVLPNLDLEASYRILFGEGDMDLVMNLRSQIFADDREDNASVDMGPFAASIHAGLAFSPVQNLAILAGYDADALTAGLSLNYRQLGLDYAFKAGAPDGLGSTQRVSVNYRW